MEFVLYCLDRPDAMSERVQRRVPHLAYASSQQHVFRFGGPLLNSAGRACGSLMILDVADRDALEAHMRADPFFAEGLFGTVTVWATRQVMPERVPGSLAAEVESARRTAGIESAATPALSTVARVMNR